MQLSSTATGNRGLVKGAWDPECTYLFPTFLTLPLNQKGLRMRFFMRRLSLFLLFALIGWVVCGGIVMGGRLIMSMQATLIAHAIGAPMVFGILAFIYHRLVPGTSPFGLAVMFLGFVVFMDIFVVALLVEKSFEMFLSPLGTWIPLILNFLSIWAVGNLTKS